MDGGSLKTSQPNEATGCAAIVSTHAVGFGDPLKSPGDHARAEFTKAMSAFRRIASEGGGTVVHNGVSGLSIAFASASQAVSAAARWQRLVPAIGTLRHRVGVHYGDAIVTDQAAMGDAFRVANELILHSAPGGICISQSVYRLAGPFSDHKVFGPARVELDSVDETVLVYRVLVDQVTPSKQSPEGSVGTQSEQRPLVRSSILSGLVAFLIVVFGVSILGSSMFGNSGTPPTSKSEDQGKANTRVDDSLKIGPLKASERTGYDSSVAIRPSDEVIDEMSSGEYPGSAFRAPRTGDPEIDGRPEPLPQGSEKQDPSGPKSQVREKGFADVRPDFLEKYDFLGLAAWIRRQSWGNSPTGRDMASHYTELAAFMGSIDRELRNANASHPLRFSTGVKENVRNAMAWMENDSVVITVAHQVRYAKLRDLPPRFVADMAEELLEFNPRTRRDTIEFRKWLQNFIDEYSLKARTNSKMSDARF